MLTELKSDFLANGCHGGLKMLVAPIFNPAVLVMICFRFSNAAHGKFGMGGKLLSKIIWRVCVAWTGCYISPAAEMGGGIRLPHPIGIVIGEGVRIGGDVTLYQHVTVGRAKATEDRYPVIGDGVTIYAGSVVVGGIDIGANAVIGANSLVNMDVPASHVAAGVPASVRSKAIG